MKLLSCQSCGKRILDEEAPYCPYCRKELRLTSTLPTKPKAEQKQCWICPNCKAVNVNEEKTCHNCRRPILYRNSWETDRSYPRKYYDKPSAIWYLVAFLFGLIGGLISYVAVKDKDKSMANTCIAIGLVVTLIGGVVIFHILGLI
jgi:RNA polymerase subunit RPABC4/transcription elongation factor Spt4